MRCGCCLDSYSVVGGGTLNTAKGSRSFVGGGQSNYAVESYATLLGGFQNTAASTFVLCLHALFILRSEIEPVLVKSVSAVSSSWDWLH